jgi:protease-4
MIRTVKRPIGGIGGHAVWSGVAVACMLVWAGAKAGAEGAGQETAPAPVIAHFHLSGALTETPVEDPFGFLTGQITSLKDLVRRLDQARRDDAVRAVVLTCDEMSLGFAQLEEVRRALKELTAAGREVFVHTGGMSAAKYALLCGASHLSAAPGSTIWLTGLYGEALYVKGLLDKIGVQADFITMGDYKSAAELFTRTGPSERASENMNWLFDGLYGSLVDMIAESRNLKSKKVLRLIDEGPYLADRARKAGLLDSVQFREEFLQEVKKRFGENAKVDNRYAEKKGPQINLANPFAVFSIFAEMAAQSRRPAKDSVAIVYIEGVILPGHGRPSPFGGPTGAFGDDIRRALEKAADNPSVKAVVMRVDSPGGSAEASEVILNAARQVRGRKPLIVSMGNVAGSGGYYVSCGADAIFANETTITGSIGVVGGKLVTTGMWDKLGVNWVAYKRGGNADLLNSSRIFDEAQRAVIQSYMEQIYGVFKGHVKKERGKRIAKPIDDLAGGRVYTGKQAAELGLVDKIGGLSDAIRFAAEKAGVADYEVRVMPEPRDFLTALIEDMSGQGERPSDIAVGAPTEASAVRTSPLLDSLLPVLSQLDPERACALRLAVQRIELIRREGVVLMMPEDIVLY